MDNNSKKHIWTQNIFQNLSGTRNFFFFFNSPWIYGINLRLQKIKKESLLHISTRTWAFFSYSLIEPLCNLKSTIILVQYLLAFHCNWVPVYKSVCICLRYLNYSVRKLQPPQWKKVYVEYNNNKETQKKNKQWQPRLSCQPFSLLKPGEYLLVVYLNKFMLMFVFVKCNNFNRKGKCMFVSTAVCHNDQVIIPILL